MAFTSAGSRFSSICDRIPHSFMATVTRIAAASVLWTAGQAKLDAPVIDLFRLRFDLEWPRLSETALELFTYQYRLPFPWLDQLFMTAVVLEHFLAALLLVGLGTRLSALILLAVTIGIEFPVYPEAYATYGVWATALLYLVARGPGQASLDHVLAGLRPQHT